MLPTAPWNSGGVTEHDPAVRLHADVRQVLAAASEDARGRGHRHLGTGHLLMGVLSVPTAPGAQRLAALGVTLHEVDLEFVRVAGYGARAAPPDAELAGDGAEDVYGPREARRRRWWQRRRPLPMSTAARAALRAAGAAAGGEVGTEHLLVGLMGSVDALARQILAGRGVTAEKVRGRPGG